MTSVRRHLASLGLVVVLCHLCMQVLVPAALCCQQSVESARRAGRAEAKDCCPAGSHKGQICPMHGAKRAKEESEPTCHAQARIDLHDLFIALTTGGIITPSVQLAAPAGSERTLANLQASPSLVSHPPLGPPPRA
jgi:hypothetical protein